MQGLLNNLTPVQKLGLLHMMLTSTSSINPYPNQGSLFGSLKFGESDVKANPNPSDNPTDTPPGNIYYQMIEKIKPDTDRIPRQSEIQDLPNGFPSQIQFI